MLAIKNILKKPISINKLRQKLHPLKWSSVVKNTHIIYDSLKRMKRSILIPSDSGSIIPYSAFCHF